MPAMECVGVMPRSGGKRGLIEIKALGITVNQDFIFFMVGRRREVGNQKNGRAMPPNRILQKRLLLLLRRGRWPYYAAIVLTAFAFWLLHAVSD